MAEAQKDYLEYMMLVNNGRGQAETYKAFAQKKNYSEQVLKQADKKDRKKIKTEIKHSKDRMAECEIKMKKIEKRIGQLQKKYITIDL